jgi:hypothetical protein
MKQKGPDANQAPATLRGGFSLFDLHLTIHGSPATLVVAGTVTIYGIGFFVFGHCFQIIQEKL